MRSRRRTERLGWFVPLRLATYVIILVELVFWMQYPVYLRPMFVTYSLLTLSFALLISLRRRHNLRTVTAVVVALQFVAEILVEGALIHATGNINSPHSALFLLTIVSASLAYRLVGTLVVASGVSFAYTFIIWLGLSGSAPTEPSTSLKTIFSTGDSVFYSIFLHILIYYLIAFVSGYLAEHLKRRDDKLADTSRALRRARLETDDILRHLNSGLLTIDANGKIIFFNRAAEKILGYREEDVKGMPCREVFAQRMPQLAGYLMDAIQSRMPFHRYETEIQTPDKNPIPLGLSISVLTEESDELRGVIAIFSDLTEAKRLEGKVRAADRLAAVGELSASIAHEIRNPLAAISGSVEVLAEELALDGENARLMTLIVKESSRLNKILSEFLSYARIDRPAFNKVELCHVVNEVIDVIRHHESYTNKLELTFESTEPIVYVVGDEDLIKQLLINLGVNACEAMNGREGKVEIRLTHLPGSRRVQLAVADTGAGIAPDKIKNIYVPFYSTKKRGTGLGLSIVHRICTALKIGIGVDSTPGHGTVFTVDFPTLAGDKETGRRVEAEVTV